MRKLVHIFGLVCVAVVYGCSNAPRLDARLEPSAALNLAPSAEATAQNKPYTALVVAYAPEMNGLLATLADHPQAAISAKVVKKGVTYHIGHYKKEPIIVFATGMSIANAAMTTQMAIDYFPLKQIIYMGIAGAVNPELLPGDVVVPARWYYHDESVYVNPDPASPGTYLVPNYYAAFMAEQPARQTADPYVPKYEPFGYVHPDEILVIKHGMEEPQDQAYFSATPRLLSAAQLAAESLPDIAVSDSRNAKLRVGGNGVTGSVFLDNRDYRLWVRKVFNADVTEMESAAVGQVAFVNDIDWLIIRSVSDLAGGQDGVNVEDTYDNIASEIAAKLLLALLDVLNQTGTNP